MGCPLSADRSPASPPPSASTVACGYDTSLHPAASCVASLPLKGGYPSHRRQALPQTCGTHPLRRSLPPGAEPEDHGVARSRDATPSRRSQRTPLRTASAVRLVHKRGSDTLVWLLAVRCPRPAVRSSHHRPTHRERALEGPLSHGNPKGSHPPVGEPLYTGGTWMGATSAFPSKVMITVAVPSPTETSYEMDETTPSVMVTVTTTSPPSENPRAVPS